jgi:hypothetical protein
MDRNRHVWLIAKENWPIVVVFLLLAYGATKVWDAWIAATTPALTTADVFQYSSIEFEKTDVEDQVLLMASTVTYWRAPDSVRWNDRLRCEPLDPEGGTVPKDWLLRASQSFESEGLDVEPLGAEQVNPWTFGAGQGRTYPLDDRRCVMFSTVTVEVDGQRFMVDIESAPFRPGR